MHANNVLKSRTDLVAASANGVKKCQDLWKQRGNKAFQEIRSTLESSCSGRVRCMYCEDSEATDIEHFYPKATYPARSFRWDNYLLACSNCNSNYKRSQFPVDNMGLPLLINPMDEDPMDHLDLSLTTGKFVPATDKGKESIKVFGLDRQVLEVGRRDAWSVFCALVYRYSELTRGHRLDEVEAAIRAIKNQSFSCVSMYTKKYYQSGGLVAVAPPDVFRVIEDNPEIVEIACG